MNQKKFGTAASDPASHLRLWITAGVGMAVDLLSKWLIWRALENVPGQKYDIIKGVLCFSLARNPGIAFGIKLGWWLIMAATLGGIVLIIYLFLTSDKTIRAGHIGMGLILAGALGNLVDRLVPPHTVRDFIDFPFWPTFNSADIFLCVGVGVLALSILRGHKETPST
ncbi:MAG: signal peptidase II [Actinobacteria bacterium]|nr:signal peptidase II [Actinomycetota bacterium]